MSHPGGISILSAFAYWTSCAIANYEIAVSYSTYSKSAQERLRNIAVEMLEDLRGFTPGGADLSELTRESAPEDWKIAQAKKEYADCVARLNGADESRLQRISEKQRAKDKK